METILSHRRRAAWTAFFLVCCLAGPADAHDLTLTDTVVVFKADGTFVADMTVDLDALALAASPSADAAELKAALEALPPEELEAKVEKLRDYFERRVRILFDGERQDFHVSFPARGTPLAETAQGPTCLGMVGRLEGRVPEGATEFSFRASRSFPPVHLTVLHQQRAPWRQVLQKGVPSEAIAFTAPPDEEPQVASAARVAGSYLVLGFWHILPAGLDHILFVLGLFLLSVRWRPLLWQVSAFTVAHTITLALATYGVVELPPRLVESLIALSIAYVAVENCLTSELKPWRVWVVFAFGLLHGLGFAGVLSELGLPREQLATALLSFNAGVEIGQLAVLAAAFVVLGWWRERSWYRARVVLPLSLLIAATGLYWAVERAFG